MRKPLLGAYLLILVIQAGCTLIPCGWDSDLEIVEEMPETEFLIGKYKLDERTLKYIQGYENAQNAELNIKSNGTFDMQKVPKGTFDFMAFYKEMDVDIDASGTWKTSYDKGTAELIVNIVFDSTKTNLNEFLTFWRIYVKDQKPVIFIMVGDPDECAAARFEKINY